MNEADGFRIEAALQFGFEAIDGEDEPGQESYFCTEAELIAFAKACERKGLADAAEVARQRECLWGGMAGGSNAASAAHHIAAALDMQIAAIDAELAPVPQPHGLEQLIADATAWFEALTPEQQEAHLREQRDSWVRGEMGFRD